MSSNQKGNTSWNAGKAGDGTGSRLKKSDQPSAEATTYIMLSPQGSYAFEDFKSSLLDQFRAKG